MEVLLETVTTVRVLVKDATLAGNAMLALKSCVAQQLIGHFMGAAFMSACVPAGVASIAPIAMWQSGECLSAWAGR